jgi:hypothetical protein
MAAAMPQAAPMIIIPSTPRSIISSKNARTALGSAPSNSVVLVVTRKPIATARRIPSTALR